MRVVEAQVLDDEYEGGNMEVYPRLEHNPSDYSLNRSTTNKAL